MQAFLDPVTSRWQEEGLFARDMDGQLVRQEEAQLADYDQRVHLWIDGQHLVVPAAVPMTDSQGNILKDRDGRTVPRRTTIYDAAVQLYERGITDAFAEREATAPRAAAPNPIPILCHQPHLSPVGVCRVCSVEISAPDRRGASIVPACHHPVMPYMVVKTKERSESVRQCVSLLVEMLVGDHLSQPQSAAVVTGGTPSPTNELAALATRLKLGQPRFSSRSVDYAPDSSSPLIAVDHNACILCERCMRGCGELRGNHVIGRTGKGYEARVAFDLDVKMRDSSCVHCGECMVSCPTDALTFRQPVESQWYQDAVAEEQRKDRASQPKVTAEELSAHPLFGSIPLKFLEWNQASIVRRTLRPGETLCRAGDYGATAFVLNRGEFGLWLPGKEAPPARPSGLLGRLRNLGRPAESAEPNLRCTPDDLLIGEMSCLSDYPRTATIRALTEAEVFEIRRNVLDMLRRHPVTRDKLDRVYRERALRDHLRNVQLFAVLDETTRRECVDYLRERIELLRVDPGQVVFRQGEPVEDFYMIRLGYVKVSQAFHGQERALRYLGPNHNFGEIGLVAQMKLLGEHELPEGLAYSRTATCTALDDVELVRIKTQDFRYLIEKYPVLRERMVELARQRIARETRPATGPPLDAFLEQGLFNGQKLLVLDLDACTRCDECSKACADTHGGVTRLVREGLHFGRFLVASACRSCTDPYCLVGCPVDAIHREGASEVTEISIADHCIGCGQCARNCPYGNINMHGEVGRVPDYEHPGTTYKAVVYKATTCDLCRSLPSVRNHPGAEVSCVYACPHHAAFRMSGQELLEQLGGEQLAGQADRGRSSFADQR